MTSVRVLSDLLDLRRGEIASTRLALTDGTDQLTYAEFAAAVGRVASALVGLGVARGDRVGVHLRKSVHSFVAVHGVLRAGAVMVPMDAFAPLEHSVAVIDDADVAAIVTDARDSVLDELGGRPSVRGLLVRTEAPPDSTTPVVSWAELDELDVMAPVEVDPDDDAYVIYTSGSTGRPKGIVHTHRSALAYVRLAAAAYELRADDHFANVASLHFDQSTFELYAAPFVGATVSVIPDAVLRFPASVGEIIERDRITVWYSVPYVLRQLVQRGAPETRDFSAVRWVLYGGESYPPDELATLMRWMPDAVISNVYGPAEVNQCMRHDLTVPPDEVVPIGRAWDETDLVVVDDDGCAAADGRGELLVASTTMMDRYWNRPDLTAASIIERSFDDVEATRWYRTGDLVDTDSNGDLVFLGRADNQVKIRGQRVELEAIDSTIRSLDAVHEVAVVADRSPAGDLELVAVVELEPGREVALRDVQRAVGARHPRAAVPVALVVAERLVRTSSAKVDRNAALAQASEARAV